MKIKRQMLKKLLLTAIFVLGVAEIGFSQASDEIPREYTNPEEMISFDRRTPYVDAIEVLTNYAQKFDDRFIIDQSGESGPIGVSLPPMHWKDALNYILRVKDLVALESDDVIEIFTQEEAQALSAPEQETTQETSTASVGGEDEKTISTDTREIRINATFFEGNKRALREIGVDWSTLTNNVPDNIADFVSEEGGGGEDGQIPNTQFGDDQFVSVNSKGAQNVSQNVFNSIINFGDVGGGIEVQALFSAFEADNLGQILATPSVKVMDGEEGRIQVGQDFSIKQRDFAGNVTDQFFSTGTILLVKPQIVEIGDTTLIYLDLEAERSSAQPDPVSTIINKQQANTHALLLDGESTVIAGLYRTEETEVRRGIPILKDLPSWFFGLKYLFGYNSTDVQESELVVLLQAELEESVNDRLKRSFESKSELLAKKKERHRNDMSYVSDKSPVPPSEPKSPPVDHQQSEIIEEESSSVPESDQEIVETTESNPSADVELNQDSGVDEPGSEISEELTQTQSTADSVDMVPEAESETSADDVVDESQDDEEVNGTNTSSKEEKPTPDETVELLATATASSDSVREETIAATQDKPDTDSVATSSTLQGANTEENSSDIEIVEGYYSSDWKPVELENVLSDNSEYEFYIIGGSFKTRTNAMQFFNDFKADQPEAQLLYNPSSGFYLVAYDGYKTFREGINSLVDINDNLQPDAWMVQVVK
ncbi:MAG: hypothetical protein GVY08_12615 [Bacteroidetes bacterium]|jgi:type IV pilus assembly protein PilQ|nr:hypothetical protein [Bacteroidota bacterium]